MIVIYYVARVTFSI